VSRLWAGRLGIQFPAGTKYLSPLQNIQTSSEFHPASYSMITWALFWR